MKQSNVSRYAYLAGIVDGEGCIRINKHTDGGYPRYSLRLQIAQKNGSLIDWLYGNFGGRITIGKGRTQRVRQGKIVDVVDVTYRWYINGETKLLPILKRILPFSTEKKTQIQASIEFCYKKLKHNKTKVRSGFIIREPNRAERDYFINVAESYYNKLKQLKKEFVPCAAVETKLTKSSNEDML